MDSDSEFDMRIERRKTEATPITRSEIRDGFLDAAEVDIWEYDAEERRLLRNRYPRLALAGAIFLGVLFLAAAIWALVMVKA